MARPSGLKLYPAILSADEVNEILSYDEYQEQSEADVQLFRIYGWFGSKEADDPTDWMLHWGEQLVERGLFSQRPNQYRVCDWVGDLSAQFKWHIDNKRHGENILAIALTPNRKIGFRDKEKPSSTYDVLLDAGDAYMMRGAARWQWEHCVLPHGQGRSGGKSLIMSYKREK